MGIFKDITGQTFGRLTVISYSGKNKSRHSLWLCKCNCGNEIIVNGASLKNGGTQSCGCLHKEKMQEMKFIDLTGQRFGRLVVTNYYGQADNRQTLWECLCDCGNKTIVSKGCLNGKKTRSCGCLAREVSAIRMHETRKKYNNYDLTGEYGIGYTFKGREFYFDLEDYDKLKDYCWSIKNSDELVIAREPLTGKNILIHRLIMDCPEDMEVDHIFHLRYDNRKSQLRIVTGSQNMMNTNIRSNNTSGIKGVSFREDTQRWNAAITKDGINISKTFINKKDAIAYRNMLEKKYHGEYALKEKEQIDNALEEKIV
ncbi:hypothetical protein [Clostridium estertheticum]|uniref:hypothetical protein n=1 Tax=Clostridium estertheticum TaxID=238834 RepID=UPI001C0D2AC0|nr:hypothetical protein [Clostridium estertheticum]MBU3186530.1 hypothetical protein [Clostridium estertheticum]